jgi:TrmH RNA methyltransferase
MKVYGLNACLAVFANRREAIVRAYVTQRQLAACAELLQWCATTRRAYHVVTSEELERVTASCHHEGICLLVRRNDGLEVDAFLDAARQRQDTQVVLLLENIANPHNLGAIVRVAAHFGASAVLLAGNTADMPQLSAAAFRTAEGGMETVPVLRVADAARAVLELRRAGFAVTATSSHTGDAIYAAVMPPRCVLMFGSETDGLSRRLAQSADRCLTIPGSGAVESLNVACAAAAILGEHWRQQRHGRIRHGQGGAPV